MPVHTVKELCQSRDQFRAAPFEGFPVAVEKQVCQILILHASDRDDRIDFSHAGEGLLRHKDKTALHPCQKIKNQPVRLPAELHIGHQKDRPGIKFTQKLCFFHDQVLIIQVFKNFLIDVGNHQTSAEKLMQRPLKKGKCNHFLKGICMKLQILADCAAAPVAAHLGRYEHIGPGKGCINLLKNIIPAVFNEIAGRTDGRAFYFR